MKNTLLRYSGKVTVETVHRKYIRKNSGTKHLFRLFSSILARENFNALSLPAYLMLYDLGDRDVDTFKMEAQDNSAFRVLKYFIDLNSSAVTDTDAFETEFTALLTSSMVLELDETQSHTFVLAIVAGNQKSLLAIVDFSSDVYTIIQSGGQAIVRWKMSLANENEYPITLNA